MFADRRTAMATTAEVDAAGVARAVAVFRTSFPDSALTAAAAAPGRVNAIGEHTDYCGGFVFPLAIDKSTYIVGGPSDDGACHVAAEAFPGVIADFSPDDALADPATPKWAMYLKGMAAIYTRKGDKVPAFNAAIISDVPLGSGLSSSAALEMATGVLIEIIGDLKVDPSERALRGQACEHEFAGVPCGIMDQLISSKGEEGAALLIDCRSLECTKVPLDDPEAVVVIANSNVTHELSGSEYPQRRKQTEDAAAVIQKAFPDQTIKLLRDATMEQLEKVSSELDPETDMRARHVIQENQRTLDAKNALDAGDLVQFGKLMYKSHVSLRDLFEVSTKEIDGLVEIAMGIEGVYGSRITGGGFGGCSVSLVRKEAVDALISAIDEKYPSYSGGKKATVFATRAGPGARVLSLVKP